MNVRSLFPLVAGAVLFAACSNNDQPVAEVALPGVERVVKEVVISSGEPLAIADLSIDGMSCEMMCGGSIKKALAKLPGITTTEIQFIEGDDRDHAIVTYDETQVTDAEMVEAIQALHDGQYKVLAVTITKQVRGSAGSTSDEEPSAKEEKGVKASLPSSEVLLPSILALLTSVLRQ
jgi:copper chaperone CopZ